MSPEKNIYTAENENWKRQFWKSPRISRPYEGELTHFQKKKKINIQFFISNRPASLKKKKLSFISGLVTSLLFDLLPIAATSALPVFFKSVGSVKEGAVYRLSHNGGPGHAGQLTEPVAAVHYRKERRRNRVAQDKVRI